MNRRHFFLNTAAIGGAALITQLPFKAIAAPGETIVVGENISSNHGHQVGLDMADIINLLRQTKPTGPMTINIQGASGHPHNITLSHEQLISLLIEGKLALDSTVDAGHSHTVELNLNIVAG